MQLMLGAGIDLRMEFRHISASLEEIVGKITASVWPSERTASCAS